VVLRLLPPPLWGGGMTAGLWGLLRAGMEPFLAAHRGVEVELFQGGSGPGSDGRAAIQAAMLAGRGPDVFWARHPRTFVEAGLLLDLGPRLRRDGLRLDIFPAGQLPFFTGVAALAEGPADALFTVPAFLYTQAYAVNLDAVRAAGRAGPEPGWTVTEWTRLWEAVTVPPGRGRRARYGTDLDNGGYDGGYDFISPYRLWGYGGEYVDPANAMRSDLASPGSLACGQARYRLLWEGVAGEGDFAGGTVVCTHHTGTYGSQVLEAEAWQGFRWDYFPDPVWPVRRAAFASTDFFAIWAGTPHAEAAWALLRWLAFGPDWQRLVMRTSLAGPNQPALWDEWKRVVQQTAPPLRTKNLDAFVLPVRRGEPYCGRLFRYANPQVEALIARYGQRLRAQQVAVEPAFRALAQQIDALERGAARTTAVRGGARRLLAQEVARAQVAGAAGASLRWQRPAVDGLGAAPAPAPALARWTRPSGPLVLVGEGGGVAGSVDSMTFAGQAWTAPRGTFSCRLVALRPQGESPPRAGAKAGLMARGTLASMSAEVGVEVAVARGVHAHIRPFPGEPLADARPATVDAGAGLLGPARILRPRPGPGGNLLLRPVWLRLAVDIDRWWAFTSLDGRRWRLALGPVGAAFLGCWVGLYATAHGGVPVLATFDHIDGFRAQHCVTIGVTAPAPG
jgi:ABC-type glycerol-3-phosphate transport system substrate-binding protein